MRNVYTLEAKTRLQATTVESISTFLQSIGADKDLADSTAEDGDIYDEDVNAFVCRLSDLREVKKWVKTISKKLGAPKKLPGFEGASDRFIWRIRGKGVVEVTVFKSRYGFLEIFG